MWIKYQPQPEISCKTRLCPEKLPWLRIINRSEIDLRNKGTPLRWHFDTRPLWVALIKNGCVMNNDGASSIKDPWHKDCICMEVWDVILPIDSNSFSVHQEVRQEEEGEREIKTQPTGSPNSSYSPEVGLPGEFNAQTSLGHFSNHHITICPNHNKTCYEA